MDFRIGQKVIHWTYGIGEILHIEDKIIRDHLTKCYVFQTSNMLIWIPLDNQQHSLRSPTSAKEFRKLFPILSGPGELLPENRLQRKSQLMVQIKDGHLKSTCQAIRDLTNLKRSGRLNEQEKSILGRAMNSLLNEWSYSLGTTLNQAKLAVGELLAKQAVQAI